VRSEASGSAGTLYVVATPIGNLEDITAAPCASWRVDLVAAEDTRHSRKLLNHFASAPVISCHEHNEQQRQEELIAAAGRASIA